MACDSSTGGGGGPTQQPDPPPDDPDGPPGDPPPAPEPSTVAAGVANGTVVDTIMGGCSPCVFTAKPNPSLTNGPVSLSIIDGDPLTFTCSITSSDNVPQWELNGFTSNINQASTAGHAITAGNTGTNFAINANTGELTTAKSPLNAGDYTLTIEYYADTSMLKTSVTKTIKVTP